jgi:hypothetical protein
MPNEILHGALWCIQKNMNLIKIFLVITILFFCFTTTIVAQSETVDLKMLDITDTVKFENKVAIFSFDKAELVAYAEETKQSDSIKYYNCKSEINFLLSLNEKVTESTIQNLASKKSNVKPSLIIYKDSLFKTFLIEEFLQKILETGNVAIFHKNRNFNIQSVLIKQPWVSHFDIFQTFINDDSRNLLFERKILMVPR